MGQQDGFGLRAIGVAVAAVACVGLADCSATSKFARRIDPKYGVSASPRVVEYGQPVPKGGGVYRTGKPYVVAGRTYVPNEGKGYAATGVASWYGTDFHGRLTANGEVFDMESISAAHPTLPMPSYVRVTNLTNHKSLIVRVNDRGPYEGNREIDLSVKAAQLLEFHKRGLTRVRVEYVGPAPLEGSDDRMLVATLRENGPAPAPSRVMVASAQPFIPQVAEPLGRLKAANIPMPDERPFRLGAAPAEPPRARVAAALPATEITSSGHGPVLTWTRGPDSVAQTTPAHAVSSFDDARQNDPIGGLISGRGLY